MSTYDIVKNTIVTIYNIKISKAVFNITYFIFVITLIYSFVVLFEVLNRTGLWAVIVGYCLYPFTILLFSFTEIFGNSDWRLLIITLIIIFTGLVLFVGSFQKRD